jgi:hypothetical protein
MVGAPETKGFAVVLTSHHRLSGVFHGRHASLFVPVANKIIVIPGANNRSFRTKLKPAKRLVSHNAAITSKSMNMLTMQVLCAKEIAMRSMSVMIVT